MIALEPTGLAPPFGHYSHGVLADRLIVTSGQLALPRDGVVPEGIEAQSEICFSQIRAILAQAGADMSHVLRFNAFVTRREDMSGYMKVRDAIVAHLPVKPSSTLVIVSGFTRPEFLVEIEALALRPAPSL